jgi:hypothetical protein
MDKKEGGKELCRKRYKRKVSSYNLRIRRQYPGGKPCILRYGRGGREKREAPMLRMQTIGGNKMKILDKKIRCVMLIASIVIGVVAAISSYISLKFPAPASAFVAVMICVPSVWQVFFMPVYLRAKHYFFSIGLYLAFWGGPVMLYALTFSKAGFMRTVGFIYLAALLVTWGLGAFLKEK